MFYPLIAETEIEVVNKNLEDQYKHRDCRDGERGGKERPKRPV